ncbi:S1 family peptidase [Corynebacterium kutscheri]|uniref:Protease n=1 Tax=Corynebacterium kutscheri TaxID=35755 RepID=A0AB38VQ33_9CORY|nr:trypsin-like serine protease [Corynebacterium kutscheri]VEH05198.1 protease [Corynebacterium kutscheri]
MSKKKVTFVSALFATALMFSSANPAFALIRAEQAQPNAESNTVVSIKIGGRGTFGDCTGTLIAPQWVVTARHCLEATNNEGSQVRLGQEDNTSIRDVDSWALSESGDVALMHLTQAVTDVTPAEVGTEQPKPGDQGTIYGWSSGSRMARAKKLPVADVTVNEGIGSAAPTEETVSDQPSSENQAVAGDEALPAEDMAFAASSFISVTSNSRAAAQGGDSGGPFFYKGKVTGVFTASPSFIDVTLPDRSALITSLKDSADWIEQVISGKDTNSIITPATAPAPQKTTQTSAPHARLYLIGSLAILVLAAVAARIKRQ